MTAVVIRKAYPPPADDPGTDGCELWYDWKQYVQVTELPGGFALALPVGAVYPATPVVVPLARTLSMDPIVPVVDKTAALANGADPVTISGLPLACRYLVTGPGARSEGALPDPDTTLVLTFATPGAYTVLLQRLSERPAEVVVNAA